RFLVSADQASDSLLELFHGLKRLVVGKRLRWERPDIAERHRAEAVCHLTGASADPAIDMDQRHPVHRSTAELDRRALEEILETVTNFLDADVGGFHGVFTGLCSLPTSRVAKF